MNREQADELIQKAAILSVLYYPQIHADDPDYALAGDVAWALEEITVLTDADRAALVDVISRVIIDPTGNREALTDLVYSLVPSADAS